MTAIFDRPIDHPMAWTVAELGGRGGLTRTLTPREHDALDEVLAATAHLPKLAVTRSEFSHPVIDRLMDEVRREVLDGRGAAVISAYDLERHSLEDYERIYWGLGAHLGTGAVQSAKGDRIGHVRNAPNEPQRGYTSNVELRPHTDFHEIMSLGGVTSAEEGGVSGIASSLAVHNAIQRERPDLLRPLYEGYYYGMQPQAKSALPMSAKKVPVFSLADGKVSCMCNTFFMRVAAERRGEALPADLQEALAFFSEVSQRPEILLQFMLEPGEMLFWNNFTQLHARTEFRDTPEHTRLLLRLWLNVPNGRSVVPEIAERARQVESRVPEPA
ncbi:MAG TPA: TauD/TfdA family dioxygenase [Hyphomicrobiales bacterium]|nr:TauD/TfdA family dioxygenase [Hyphomicrobiales bacterium]